MRSVVRLLMDQVEVSDVIIMNKADLVNAEQLQQLQLLLRSLNPTAKLVESQFGRVPLNEVLGTGLFQKRRTQASRRQVCQLI
jgi:G3E family GTPase